MNKKPHLKARTIYINCRSLAAGCNDGIVETIDHFPANTPAERLYITEMLNEYRMAFSNYRGIYKSKTPAEGYDEC
jgi:hypothetical protein